MSDQPEGQMTPEEEIAALRKDAEGSSEEHQAAQLEILRLEGLVKASQDPDEEIRAGKRALFAKFRRLFEHRG